MHNETGLSARTVLSSAAILFAAIFLSAFLIVNKADATITPAVAASLTSFNQTIKASSVPTAVIGLNLVSDSEKFASTSVAFLGSAGFATTTDLAAVATSSASSGIALFRDNKSTGVFGQFDPDDVFVPLQSAIWNGATTTLSLFANETVPINDLVNNLGNDYFIVIQTSAGAVNDHAFTVNMYPGSIQWSASTPTNNPAAVSTNTVTIDTVAPTLNAGMTGPANNSTGVPVSTFIHLGFSERLDPTTVNSTNVTLTSGGTP
ncbi:MAG: Ig-like domain-containing protein, partial [Patescibacteria group bacterium]